MLAYATMKMDGYVGEFPVKVLRDSGCNWVVLRRSLVTESQLTGKTSVLMLIDQSLTEVPTARCFVKKLHFVCREIEVLCLFT